MDAGRGIGGAGPTSDEADAGPARGLADRFGHDRGAAFMPADRERDIAVVEGIERGQIAFPGNAEGVAHAVDDQLVHEDFAAAPHIVFCAHTERSDPGFKCGRGF